MNSGRGFAKSHRHLFQGWDFLTEVPSGVPEVSGGCCWSNDVWRIILWQLGSRLRSLVCAVLHPSPAVIFRRPSEQASRKTFLWYLPL
jgi:hypothetical protein